MTDRHADWRTALDAFDTSAQIHGWAADMGTEKQALQARRDYERDKAIVCAAVLAVVAERDALRGHLEWAVAHIDVLGGNNKILRAALAQGES